MTTWQEELRDDHRRGQAADPAGRAGTGLPVAGRPRTGVRITVRLPGSEARAADPVPGPLLTLLPAARRAAHRAVPGRRGGSRHLGERRVRAGRSGGCGPDGFRRGAAGRGPGAPLTRGRVIEPGPEGPCGPPECRSVLPRWRDARGVGYAG